MKKVSILPLCLAIFIISCQKNVDDPGSTGGSSSADSIYLDRLIVLDTTLPAGRDTVEKFFCEYDHSKRIKTVVSYWVGVRDSSRQEYFYEGDDSLPVKTVHHRKEDHGAGLFHYVDTIYFNYANGKVRKDSVASWNLTTGEIAHAPYVSEYMVSGNGVKKVSRTYRFDSGRYLLLETDTADFNVTYSGGNLTAHTSASSGPHDVFVEAEFDNKPNPLAKIFPVKYPVFDSHVIAAWYNQNNNPLFVQFQFEEFSPVESDQFTYIHRSDNYPLIAICSSTMILDYNKILYFYTAL